MRTTSIDKQFSWGPGFQFSQHQEVTDTCRPDALTSLSGVVSHHNGGALRRVAPLHLGSQALCELARDIKDDLLNVRLIVERLRPYGTHTTAELIA